MLASGAFQDPRAVPVKPEDISKAFLEASPWDGSGPLMLSAGFMLLGFAVLCGLWLFRNRDTYPLPQMTFFKLGAGLGLSLGQRARLWWVSRASGLPTPIVLMLCPATFDHHAGAYLARTPASVVDATRSRLVAIRELLFPDEAKPRY